MIMKENLRVFSAEAAKTGLYPSLASKGEERRGHRPEKD